MTLEHEFEPGSLWGLVGETTDRAQRTGALQPIPTDLFAVDHGGLPFLVRVVSHFARKPRPESKASGSTDGNPFLPYDAALFVAGASKTHVCLLNKFMVVNHHVLIVTREFVHQQAPLDRDDFLALGRCMREYNGLGFYNSGILAGASQPHKHLQFIPLPLVKEMPQLPADRVIGGRRFQSPQSEGGFPFQHLIVSLADNLFEDVSTAADVIDRYYRQMTRHLGLIADAGTNIIAQPYNLLITRRWLMLVPRTAECFEHISLNSMAFAGALLVHNEEQLARVQATSWLSILQAVTAPL